MKHIEAFLNVMKADAALIHRPENMRWLSGYAGEGCLFITRDARCIVTDFRYIEQAGREASDWQGRGTRGFRSCSRATRSLPGRTAALTSPGVTSTPCATRS